MERLFAWLGQFRRLVVRHERRVEVFRGFVLVTFILIFASDNFERGSKLIRPAVRDEHCYMLLKKI